MWTGVVYYQLSYLAVRKNPKDDDARRKKALLKKKCWKKLLEKFECQPLCVSTLYKCKKALVLLSNFAREIKLLLSGIFILKVYKLSQVYGGKKRQKSEIITKHLVCLLYTSPSPRD